jgi:predicted phosphodiesterase
MSRALKLLLLVLLGVGVAVPTAYTTFIHSQRDIVIGAHDATVQPDFSGHARIDFGPIIPQIRIPAGAPLGLGVTVTLGESEVTELDDLVARDAVIASQPQGEIASVRSTILSMVVDALLRALGTAVLVVLIAIGAWRAVGSERRHLIWGAIRHPDRRQTWIGAGVGVLVVAALVLVAVPERPRGDERSWVPIDTVFPELPSDRVLDTVEIAEGTSTTGSKKLVEGALATYRASVEFYGKLALTAATVNVRTPLEGEKTAIVVTDRHDNIGMDPVVRAIADRARARMVIDLGDDTSNGASWEEFSINSLAREFRGFDIVSVAGNHDTGPYVAKQMEDKGFTLLSGEPVEVDGIRFLGNSDPRSSGLTAGYTGNESENITAIRDEDEKLTTAACDDGSVSVIAVHSPSSAKRAAASGCADLVLSGHLHRQVGPTVATGDNGRSTVTLSTGTTGGAVYTFALGSKLRRDAQVSLVTFADGLPVGVQPVTFQTGGSIQVGDFVPITPTPR